MPQMAFIHSLLSFAITTAPPPWAGILLSLLTCWGYTSFAENGQVAFWTLEDAEDFSCELFVPDAGITEVLKLEIREKEGEGDKSHISGDCFNG